METSAATDRLVEAIQELSLARTIDDVTRIVRTAARQLVGADGATFVLREGDQCFYADEDAISPLWRGSRFPMSACISGWAMLNRQSVSIDDIYADARIPADAYRPTFVKSLLMVPIRVAAPIGAIGTYWATHRKPSPSEVTVLQTLANSTSMAMANVQLFGDLERRVRERTAELQAVNNELKSFSYSVSHDLRAPLRSIDGFGRLLEEDCLAALSPTGVDYLRRMRDAAGRMGHLIDALLSLAHLSQSPLRPTRVDLSDLAREAIGALQQAEPNRIVAIDVQPDLQADGDKGLLRVALTNLLSNAWKFTRRAPDARIEVGARFENEAPVFFVRDNGAGFDPRYADQLFGPFQRLHSADDFEGTGIGLATVARVMARHGGRIWAESRPNHGATFSFQLGELAAPAASIALS